ncbi:hypothetical protein CYLTODRAFT_451897 [Cylindrobasidium torrendii FP15055 ss-10]|uniref:DUF6534 domain-containing protein n=1 Tax=Cylindrobasidium torrendii FP15055 ss-10 TaxID=1314674 RepID=A0A0D7BKU4_9AGAR|nr:hypothetical protein CYLTODRAFT_451897 [Cylindrobasidium torrendii FP15055 ss-10]
MSQAWFYFSGQGSGRQFSDSMGLKSLVAVVVALDFIHTLCTTMWMYGVCVTDFGQLEKLAVLPDSYFGMAYPTGFITILVQGFYIWRIWKLAHGKIIIPVFLGLCACAQEGTQLYSMSVIGAKRDSTQFTGDLTNIVIAVNGMGAAIDVLIALAMIYLLASNKTRMARTNRILRDIAIYSVTTGAMTSICAILVLVTAIALPAQQYVLLFYVLLSRMYANSILATLNVRESLRGTSAGAVVSSSNNRQLRSAEASGGTQADNSYQLGDLKRADKQQDHITSSNAAIAIKIDRQTDLDYE